MLMLEKKKDIITLRNLGADSGLLRRIFLLEGWMISASGALLGAILGLADMLGTDAFWGYQTTGFGYLYY